MEFASTVCAQIYLTRISFLPLLQHDWVQAKESKRYAEEKYGALPFEWKRNNNIAFDVSKARKSAMGKKWLESVQIGFVVCLCLFAVVCVSVCVFDVLASQTDSNLLNDAVHKENDCEMPLQEKCDFKKTEKDIR